MPSSVGHQQNVVNTVLIRWSHGASSLAGERVHQPRQVQARPGHHALPWSSGGGQIAVPTSLTGTAAGSGTATGAARIVRGPSDFACVRPGDILICPYTDPAWTPLLRIASGVVTEVGGVLSHAAIVARELRIPAVVGVPDATTRLHDGDTVTLDGAAGTVTLRVI